MAVPRILFVTGKLAEPALRRLLTALAPRAGFDFSVAVLPISAVALATTPWIARHLPPVSDVERVLLPGLCSGDLQIVAEHAGAQEAGERARRGDGADGSAPWTVHAP